MTTQRSIGSGKKFVPWGKVGNLVRIKKSNSDRKRLKVWNANFTTKDQNEYYGYDPTKEITPFSIYYVREVEEFDPLKASKHYCVVEDIETGYQDIVEVWRLYGNMEGLKQKAREKRLKKLLK
ncbi:MAG: hypothetical protein SLAVMIC_00969 [uncultured marine phage]|uniref:Uncharacterized protein n=1 Tax=uncultured marine phage TaxID=707152 RepID=A0A8D9FSK4_9VIRU|nr:MAG: hypothetical protein SLAVMIC_00969 [uncultured marine phage]